MSATRSLTAISSAFPLMGGRRGSGRPSLGRAARFLRRAGSRRLRETSTIVRENAAEQLQERQSDWAYSKPVVLLDMVWNLGFIAVASLILYTSREEKTGMPLRLWLVGYALQCAAHMVCVSAEYRRRRRRASSLQTSPRDVETGYSADRGDRHGTSTAKRLESANTTFSFIWWIIGFYCVSAGGSDLSNDAPQLYWACIIYLAFDVFFVVFCVAVACVISLAVCCCLPCIIAILYAVADQLDGASDEEIRQLPTYKFRRTCDSDKLGNEISSGGIMTECGTDTPLVHELSAKDAECCICLCDYDDGVELRQLPCNHHFHCSCIEKWLYINATCPLCKYNIVKNSNNIGREEEV